MIGEKTNMMRVLDQKKISYVPHWYPSDRKVDGISVAEILEQDPARVFKTPVTVGEKSITIIKQAELLPLTDYIHGGCSPIGMKTKEAN